MKKTVLFLLFLLPSNFLFAQEENSEENSIFNMSLEELMDVQVTVSARQAISLRENPGIVTVISEQEIKNSGAKDLLEVLRMVPGIQFSTDVQGVVGISMRGNWAHEGKVLLIIDGNEMNELAYSTLQFGQHYPVDLIKKIEVIRGPGSSTYGGNAELGVIQITTKKGEDLKGGHVGTTVGTNGKELSRLNGSLSIGSKKKDFEFAVHGFGGKGIRSSNMYSDIYGTSMELGSQQTLSPTFIQTTASYKGFNASIIYDGYSLQSVDWFDTLSNPPFTVGFKGLYGNASYTSKVGENFTITPKFSFKTQSPWQTQDSRYEYSPIVSRWNGEIFSEYKINASIKWQNTLQGYYDTYDSKESSTNSEYSNIAFSSQFLISSSFANITVGGRVDQNSFFGTAITPRLALTKVWKNVHVKALYSHAFRAPGFENFNLNPQITPEKTRVIEMETGVRINDHMQLNLNVFQTTIVDPIIYFYDEENDLEAYTNFEQTGTRGFELEYTYLKKGVFQLKSNYSFYAASGLNKVDLYEVEGNSNALLGNAQHKVGIQSFVKIKKTFTISPSINLLGKRNAMTSVDSFGEPVLEVQSEKVLFNINLAYDNFLARGLNVSISCFDILNQAPAFIQAYSGYHSPIPSMGREFRAQIAYQFGTIK